MMLSRRLSLLVAGVLVSLLSSCSPGGSGKIQIGIVTNNPNDWWNIAEAGARKAEKELDVEVLFRRPSPDTTAEQKKIVDAMVNQGVKGIALSVLDPKNQAPYIDSIVAKVPILAMDNDSPDSKRLCYVGTDNYEAGKAVGRLVKEAMPDGGTIAIFVGRIEPLNAQQRYHGVLDELAGEKDAKGPTFGKFKLYGDGPQTDEGDEKKAKDRAAAVMNALKMEANIVMVGLWAYNPPAILDAAKAANMEKKIKIVGFDEKRATLKAIADGDIYATVVQDPFEFGYRCVKILTAVAKGDKSMVEKKEQYVDYRVITKDGGTDPVTKKERLKATEFEKQLDELMAAPKK